MKSILFWWHSIVIMWRDSLGRWYVFRDRPLWFVEEFAELPLSTDRDVRNLVYAARMELSLRQRYPEKK